MFLILISISFLFLSGCEHSVESPNPSISVTTMTVVPQTIPAVYEYVGVAQSSHLVEIRARVEGFLDKIAYSEGELVHADELLFQIDPKPFEAALAHAKAYKEQQEAILWDARRSAERLKPLYEQKAASLRDLDTALAQEHAAKAAVDGAQAQIIQAELNLSYTTIRSPITGLAADSKFRQGSLVGPNYNSLLTTVSALDPIWVNFYVSEGDLLKYRKEESEGHLVLPKGMNFEIEVIFSNGTLLPSRGIVDFADPSFQTETGSMNVRAVLPNPGNLLHPGQFVRARLLGAMRPNAIIIPQVSVMQGSKGFFVYVITPDDVVEMRPIEVGDWYQNSWIITSGLQAGDRVVVEGVNKVTPGSKVIVEQQTTQ